MFYIDFFFIVSSNFVFSVTSIFFIGQRGEGAEIQLYFMTNADFSKYPICNNLLRKLSLGEKNAFKLDLYNISIAVLSEYCHIRHILNNQRSSNKLQFLFTVKYVRKTIFYRSYFLGSLRTLHFKTLHLSIHLHVCLILYHYINLCMI